MQCLSHDQSVLGGGGVNLMFEILLLSRDATIQFFSETIRSRKFWGSADANTSAVFLCRISLLLCVDLNHTLIKCWVCSPKVGRETVLSGSRIVYSQRNDINKIHNSKCFSDARFLLYNMCLKAVDTSVRCRKKLTIRSCQTIYCASIARVSTAPCCTSLHQSTATMSMQCVKIKVQYQ